MKIIVAGHLYGLKGFESGVEDQEIQFIQKEPVVEGSTELKTISDGTTNEEVLKMLINRMQHLNGMVRSRENSLVITKMEEALMWLEKRTKDRENRGVEGMQKP